MGTQIAVSDLQQGEVSRDKDMCAEAGVKSQ